MRPVVTRWVTNQAELDAALADEANGSRDVINIARGGHYQWSARTRYPVGVRSEALAILRHRHPWCWFLIWRRRVRVELFGRATARLDMRATAILHEDAWATRSAWSYSTIIDLRHEDAS